jgi:hypothetical protein
LALEHGSNRETMLSVRLRKTMRAILIARCDKEQIARDVRLQCRPQR